MDDKTYSEIKFQVKKRFLMERCFECLAENGLWGTGIRALGASCGCNSAVLYTYFKNLDALIIESVTHCMNKIEDEYKEIAPTTEDELWRFIDELPYWTAENHGKDFRLMYQIYTHPKYIEEGKKFLDGVNQRYMNYAKRLERNIGIPYDVIMPLIYILMRASIHFALFGDENYLKTQMDVIKEGIKLFYSKYKDHELD